MTEVSVLGFGDSIVDRFLDRQREYPGGNALNVAVMARRLGARAGYLGTLGTDAGSNLLRDSLDAEGVDISCCPVVDDGSTGWTNVDVRDGERVFLEWNGGGVTTSHPPKLSDDDLVYVASFDVVHSSVYSHVDDELASIARLTDCLISYDASDREADPRLRGVIDLTLSSTADPDDLGPAARQLAALGCPLMLITHGARGASVLTATTVRHYPANEVAAPIVDTMGAGDAFLAGVIVELLRSGWRRGQPPAASHVDQAVQAGMAAAAAQLGVEGAFGYGQPIAAV